MIRRKYRVIAATIALLLIVGDVAYWRIAADRLRSGYQDWLAARVAEGWVVSSGPLSIGGWPRTAKVIIPALSLRHAGSAVPGAMEATLASVTLSIALIDPVNLLISMTGPAHVRVADAPDLVITSEEDRISVPLLWSSGPQVIDLRASGLRIEPANGAWQSTSGLLNARVSVAEEVKAEPSEPAATFALSAEAIALPGVMKWPLGPNISSLALDGAVNGPLPAPRDITGWAEAWRDGGGSVAISHLAMGWGPLGLSSSATLALDEQLQPMGSGSARIVGYASTLDRLAAAGVLTKSAATAAKAVLSLMVGTSDGDEQPAVDVPLTLQYRTLSMRQVPLLRLPELDWPPR